MLCTGCSMRLKSTAFQLRKFLLWLKFEISTSFSTQLTYWWKNSILWLFFFGWMEFPAKWFSSRHPVKIFFYHLFHRRRCRLFLIRLSISLFHFYFYTFLLTYAFVYLSWLDILFGVFSFHIIFILSKPLYMSSGYWSTRANEQRAMNNKAATIHTTHREPNRYIRC